MTPLTPSNAAIRSRSPAGAPEDDRINRFLKVAQPLADTHALVVADHALELLCGLIRRGCAAATCLQPSAKPDAPIYTLVLAPGVARISALDAVIHTARHALLPGGRIVIGLPHHHSNGRLPLAVARRLRLNGFTGVRTQDARGLTVVHAELPACRGQS